MRDRRLGRHFVSDFTIHNPLPRTSRACYNTPDANERGSAVFATGNPLLIAGHMQMRHYEIAEDDSGN